MEGRPRVLVIDDEPDMVEMLKMALERQFEVIVAYDGKSGLAKVRAEHPAAIVLDIMMPEKDGFATCKELKGDPQTSAIPILILTGVAEHFSRTKFAKLSGMEIEAEDFIAKPVDPNELIRRVGALLRKA
jgi:two-component system, OmpR family, alkaline phosphatase synthesis response regulator PhoP